MKVKKALEMKPKKNRIPCTESSNTTRMRKTSRTVRDMDKMVLFIYLLGRDYLPLGEIETIMKSIPPEEKESIFTNGWLANYARDVSKRLKNEKDKSKKSV